MPWPSRGQSAVAVPSLGVAEQSGPESPVPIASLTKITTAVVVLRDHPVAAGAPGPTITVTAEDYGEYDFEVHNDESSVPIHVGQQLTEQQLLEALLTQSANDAAFTLATWDAGSVPAFVAKMNGLATSLGATNSHYVDASGYSPSTVSSAADVLKMAAAGMAIPAFASIVAMPSITFPQMGKMSNLVPEVGSNEVVGVKTGYTSEAGACMVLAADQVVKGRSVLVMVDVLGQSTPPPEAPTTTTTMPTGPGAAGEPAVTTTAPHVGPTTTTTSLPYNDRVIADPFKFTRPTVEALLQAGREGVVPVLAAPARSKVGTVSVQWGGVDHAVAAVSEAEIWLPGWPGQVVHSDVRFHAVTPGSRAGTRVGTVLYSLGTERQATPVVLEGTVPEPDWWWRLLHGR